jgi:hypothetical protein
MERRLPVRTIYQEVENKRNIDGKRSHVEGEFELVFVIDVPVEISRFRNL